MPSTEEILAEAKILYDKLTPGDRRELRDFACRAWFICEYVRAHQGVSKREAEKIYEMVAAKK